MQAKKDSFDKYKSTQAKTASRGELLLMMYEGAIRFLKKAIEATEEKKHKEKIEYIEKTRKIVKELQRTLDYERGGEIALNLDRLYAFITHRLIHGTLKRESKPLLEALEVLESLYSGWKEAVNSVKTNSTSDSKKP